MKQFQSASAFVLISLFALPIHASSAEAEKACVYLKPGAGYSAKMRIEADNYKSKWSKSFPIGQMKCKSLKHIPVGNEFTVEVKADLGKKKHCKPRLRKPEGNIFILYVASGTTLDVKCKLP